MEAHLNFPPHSIQVKLGLFQVSVLGVQGAIYKTHRLLNAPAAEILGILYDNTRIL